MRILLLNDRVPPDHRGGAEVAAWRLAERLARDGHDVHVAAATRGRAREETRDGVQVYLLHSSYPERFQPWVTLWNPQTARSLLRLYQRLRPDVVHAHAIQNALSHAALINAARLGLATVATVHDIGPVWGGKLDSRHFGHRAGAAGAMRLRARDEVRVQRLRYNPFRRPFVRRVLARCAVVRTCVSHAQRQMLAANGVDGVEVIHNGVDPAMFESPPGTVHPAVGASGRTSRKLVLFGGRLGPLKGSRVLGKAFQLLSRGRDDVGLLVLSRQAADVSMLWPGADSDSRVEHGGWLAGAALAEGYRRAAVAVVPSLTFECGGLMALEAMAASLPVVASPYGGLPEHVADGITGVLVRPEDPAALARALAGILDDEERRRHMGAAGRERVRAHFTLDTQVCRFLDVYQRAATSR